MSELAAEPSRRGHRSRRSAQAHSKASRPKALWPLASLCLVAALWLMPESWRQLRADLATGPSRGATTRVSTPHPLTTEGDWQEALDALERSVAIAPDNVDSQADLGALYGSASLRADISPEQRAEYALIARLHDQAATRLRPTEPRGWAELARAELLTGNAGPSYVQAWELAAQLGSAEAMVQGQLLELTFATYPDPHTPAMAEWVRQLYAAATPQKRETMQKVAAGFEVSISAEGQLSALAPNPSASGP